MSITLISENQNIYFSWLKIIVLQINYRCNFQCVYCVVYFTWIKCMNNR